MHANPKGHYVTISRSGLKNLKALFSIPVTASLAVDGVPPLASSSFESFWLDVKKVEKIYRSRMAANYEKFFNPVCGLCTDKAPPEDTPLCLLKLHRDCEEHSGVFFVNINKKGMSANGMPYIGMIVYPAREQRLPEALEIKFSSRHSKHLWWNSDE